MSGIRDLSSTSGNVCSSCLLISTGAHSCGATVMFITLLVLLVQPLLHRKGVRLGEDE